jgi:hypothetical protein
MTVWKFCFECACVGGVTITNFLHLLAIFGKVYSSIIVNVSNDNAIVFLNFDTIRALLFHISIILLRPRVYHSTLWCSIIEWVGRAKRSGQRGSDPLRTDHKLSAFMSSCGTRYRNITSNAHPFSIWMKPGSAQQAVNHQKYCRVKGKNRLESSVVLNEVS